MSFRLKTILGIALIEAVLLMLLVWIGMDYLNNSNRMAMTKEAKNTAKLFVTLTKDAVLSTDLATLNEAVDELISRPEIKYIRIVSQGQSLVERGDKSILARPFVADEDLDTVNDGVFDIREAFIIDGLEFASITLGFSTIAIDNLLSEAEKNLYVIAIVEMLLVALFSYFLGIYLTQMLTRLRVGVDSITQGEFGKQIKVDGKDELARTATAFNLMSNRLLESDREMKRRIDESIKLSDRLKQSELRTRTILNTAVDGFIIIDEFGIMQDVNTAAANTFGYQHNQMVGKNVSSLMPQPFRDEHDGYLQSYLNGGEAKVIGVGREVIGLRADGTTFPMDLSVSEMVMGNQRLFVGLVRDITEKRSIEDIAKRNEALMSAIFDSSLDALITIDVEGKVIEFSKVAEEMFIYRREDVIGGNMASFIIPPEFRAAHEQGMQHFLKTGEGVVLNKRIELSAMRSSGEVFPVEVTISPIEVAGSQLFTASLRDITDLKQWKSELNDAKKNAEAASEAKSRFLAHMSHEIRSPLNAVLGSLDLLSDSNLNQEQMSYTNTAQTSGTALLGVINDILDFSKIEAGEMKLNENNFFIRELVVDVLELIDYRVADKAVDVASTLSHDFPAMLYGDSGRVRQILINLMDNAIKFTKQGSVVLTVTVKQRIDEKVVVRFHVEDMGEGISVENQKKLFNEFSQVDNSDAARFGGAGLGLAICKQLVNIMGGDIGVDSVVGKGSRFWFEIPFSVVDNMQTSAISEYLNKNILIVGLSKLARNAIGYQTDIFGCTYEDATNGRQALEMIADKRNDPYDYILVDESINDIDIKLFVKRVKSESTSKLVLIPRDKRRLFDGSGVEGVDHVLRRPFHVDNLLQIFIDKPNISSSDVFFDGQQADEVVQSSILLVEDSKSNQLVATSMLKKYGYHVDVANDGLEAITLFTEGRYDLILMDLRMPNMTGLEATVEIRKLKKGADIPIIAMTANTMQSDIERCIKSGMNDHVSKPFKRAILLDTIKQWLEKSHHSSDDKGNDITKKINVDVPLVNNKVFVQLEDDTSKELVPEMISMFKSECAKRIAMINNKVQLLPISELMDQAHTLKSLAATFGTPRLEVLARKMEQFCKEGDNNSAYEMSAAIMDIQEETFSLYTEQFEEYLNGSSKGIENE